MPKKQKKIVNIILIALSLGSLLLFMLEWDYSPLQKALAFTSLHTGTYSSKEEAISYWQTLIGKEVYDEHDIMMASEKAGIPIKVETLEKANLAVPFKTITTTAPNFLIGEKYTYPYGSTGIKEIMTNQILYNGTSIYTYSESEKILIEPTNAFEFTGQLTAENIKAIIKSQWSVLLEGIKSKNSKTLESVLTDREKESTAKFFKLSNLQYKFEGTQQIELKVSNETPEQIQIGTITHKQKNCSKSAKINIIYVKDTQEYKFENVYSESKDLCSKPPTSGTLTCSNCWLAPVSKPYGLSSSYIPYVVSTGVNGGGYVTPATKNALQKMISAAKDKGLTPRVSSSYRSYTVQESLFNSYVNNEMATGLSYAQAVVKANTYSAKPGHSEHQLGTTVDILNCPYPCGFFDSKNNALFSFFLNNAYKYGFAMSYPNGSQAYTGYVYEPWHLRYIGVERATELYNKGYLSGKGYYLVDYLLEKGEY